MENLPKPSGKVQKGFDYADNDADPMDVEGHGTHVAGIIGAKTNNGVGIAGVGYNVNVLAIRVLGPGGGTVEWVAQGMMEAADKGADIINMSLGSFGDSQMEEDAVNYAWNRGVVVLAASGNAGVSQKFYPAAYENCIAVGATDQNDRQASFSNWGSDWVDVAAPGVAVLSTIPNGQYAAFDGTSMACPNASAVAALIISYAEKGNMTNAEIRETLESNTINVGNWVAKGLVNAFTGVSAAVRPIIEDVAPNSATMFHGSSHTGNAASLAANDNSYYRVTSKTITQLGQASAIEATFPYTYGASRWMGGKLSYKASARLNATMTAFLKRNNGTYLTLKSRPMSGSELTQTINLPSNISQFVQNGTITVVFRTHVPARYGNSTFTLSMNSANIQTRTNPRVVTP